MRYYYGTNDSYTISQGRSVTAKQLASIIKRDVEYGKWNLFNGGREDSQTASCSYHKPSFTYHERLFIKGKKTEFKELEKLIQSFIEVIPRQYS